MGIVNESSMKIKWESKLIKMLILKQKQTHKNEQTGGYYSKMELKGRQKR